MNLKTDRRIVLTLDAGGTNLVFNAIQGGEELFPAHRLKSKASTLDELLKRIISGFETLSQQLEN